MKSQSPAVAQGALAATAGRKAHKIQRKLKQAEAELHTANEILVKAPARDNRKIEVAVQQNVAAEEKVHDAAEELQVVKELLAEAAEADAHGAAGSATVSVGQTGEGVRSLIPHLERRRAGETE